MIVVIEYYRTRTSDDAHALLGLVHGEASDLHDAVALAHKLLLTRELPQRPDAFSVSDPAGRLLFFGPIKDGPLYA